MKVEELSVYAIVTYIETNKEHLFTKSKIIKQKYAKIVIICMLTIAVFMVIWKVLYQNVI